LHRYEAGKGTGDPERDMNANDRQEKRVDGIGMPAMTVTLPGIRSPIA
jgi:hypothetical protein